MTRMGPFFCIFFHFFFVCLLPIRKIVVYLCMIINNNNMKNTISQYDQETAERREALGIINITDISECDFIRGRQGKYRAIVKCRAGFMTCQDFRDHESKSPNYMLCCYKKNALQTIEFQADGTDHWLTVFARKGKTIVLMDIAFMADLKVGTVNQLFHDTNMFNASQYRAVNSKTWESKVFVMNQVEEVAV